MRSFVIKRGGYGPQTYWAGFKGDDQVCPRTKKRLRWSRDPADAIRFVRAADANSVRLGLRMFRLSPVVREIDDAA